MSELLPADRLAQLLPALRHLAELVRQNGPPARADLHLLLLASGLADTWAIDELERWSLVLNAVRGSHDPARREVAQRALALRGVPEAPAALALGIVAGPRPQDQPPRRVVSSVERLDLGTLAPGATAATEFEVAGGPGQVVVESEQVQVQPQEFGSAPTRIRVAVRPLAAGVLWTNVRLITPGEVVELPLVAQWVAAPPAAAPSPILKPACPQCGHNPSAGGKFCSRCGSPLAAGVAPGASGSSAGSAPSTRSDARCVLPTGQAGPSAPAPPPVPARDVTTAPSSAYPLLWERANHTAWVHSLAFSPDGTVLASGAGDGTVCLYRSADSALLLRLRQQEGRSHSLAFSPNNQLLATATADHVIRLWRLADGAAVGMLHGHIAPVTSLAFSPDGRLLATTAADETVCVWELAQGTCLLALNWWAAPKCGIAFSPDGTLLAAGVGAWDPSIVMRITAESPTLTIWDVNMLIRKAQRRIPGEKVYPWHSRDALRYQWNAATGVEQIIFSPNGSTLAVVGGAGKIELRSLGPGPQQLYWPGQADGTELDAASIAFGSRGIAAVGGSRGLIQLWQLRDGRAAGQFQAPPTPIWSLAFSPDGRHLAAGGDDGRVRLWRLA
jgi:hypothetical protein